MDNVSVKKLDMLLAGLGSIGRRHLRNMMELGIEKVTLLRSGNSTLDTEEFSHLPVTSDLRSALADKPDAVVISTPTSLHMEMALQAAEAGSHILLEKPISHNLAGLKELEFLVKQNGVQILVGFQFRFHPTLTQIKTWIDDKILGEVLGVHVEWGEYLPGWHPWEDYRKGYSARKDLGGGVLLTLCHPFDYLNWFFGPIESVYAKIDQRSALQMDTEDKAITTLKFKSGLTGTVLLNYFRRPPKHQLTITCEEGIISWDNEDACAVLLDGISHRQNRICPSGQFERNHLFLDEMSHFIDCIQGHRKPACTLEDGAHALKVVLAAKRSSAERKEIDIENIV